MKSFLNVLGGFLAIVTILSFTGNASLFFLLVLFGGILYLFFYDIPFLNRYLLLIGATAGLELLSPLHIGKGSMYALIIYLIGMLFAGLFRFTSEYVRYIVAVFLAFCLYPLIFFEPRQFFAYSLSLGLAYCITLGLSALLLQQSHKTEYELL